MWFTRSPQRRCRILDVLEHVQADHGVELSGQGPEGHPVRGVQPHHLEVRPAGLQVLEVVEMGGLDVARHVAIAGQQLEGEVADPGADLEDPRAHGRAQAVGHPPVEPPGSF
ncbi:MAG: hypothetical protein L0191_09700, partial [Acidobacteria bacterium]|nr:hypothetical protein [Acidobacteriota bacterium]